MPNDISQRIAHLKQQREKLSQKLNRLEHKEKSQARKLDTRRKIIVGGAVVAEMHKDPEFAAVVRAVLLRYVARPNDRAAVAELLAPS
jgi:hypothetical protein